MPVVKQQIQHPAFTGRGQGNRCKISEDKIQDRGEEVGFDFFEFNSRFTVTWGVGDMGSSDNMAKKKKMKKQMKT